MVKAVIVDDEQNARDLIELILARNFKELTVVDKAPSVIEGIKSIQKNNPDIVFLDIEMQDGTGFDILEAIPDKNFDFIFVTAFNQYAIKAFKYSAVDYVLKPVDEEDLTVAVKKILNNRKNVHKTATNYNVLKRNLKTEIPVKIALPVLHGIEFVNTTDIISFNADGRYTRIFLTDGTKITVSKSLGEFNDLIDNVMFFKSHKSHIINLNYVKTYVKKGGYIIMDNETEVPLARTKREDFMTTMSNRTFN